MLYLVLAVVLDGFAEVVSYFPGTRGTQMLGFESNSGIEGFLKNAEKSSPRKVKRRRHYTTVDKEIGAVGQYACGAKISDYLKIEEGLQEGESFFNRKIRYCLCWIVYQSSVIDIRKKVECLLIKNQVDQQRARLLTLKKITDRSEPLRRCV